MEAPPYETSAKAVDEKTGTGVVNTTDNGVEHGHLTELEVDLSLILEEKGEEDYDAAHSPFPEGRASTQPHERST